MDVKRYKLAALIYGIHQRTSLTMKMIVLAVVIGFTVWYTIDLMYSRKIQVVFQDYFNNILEKQSLEDRGKFDRYVKAHHHSVKLFITQKNFSDYVEARDWESGDEVEIIKYNRTPPWFPPASVLRTFAQPRYALLFDRWGQLREVYTSHGSQQMPSLLKNPTQELLLKSNDQDYITEAESLPFLAASKKYKSSRMEEKAILMVASPIDDIFLSNALGANSTGNITAIISSDQNRSVIVSSNNEKIPTGMTAEEVNEEYVITGKEFFDYGGSELPIRFVSLISKSDIRELTHSILASNRKLRIIGLPLFVIPFSLLMFYVTYRIQRLRENITLFSEQTLGVYSREDDWQKGDQLLGLEKRFQSLTEEMLEARDALRKEAEEKLVLEKKNMESREKEKHLVLLQAVTQSVGVGVIKKTSEGLTAVNEKMMEFEESCGELYKFDICDDGEAELRLKDKKGLRRIFSISSPDILNEERILLVRDVTKAREQTEALEHLAMHDTLTGLPNRALLYDRIQQAIFTGQRKGEGFALFMMDLDRFKEINDTLGHHIGDLVLKETGKRLLSVLRTTDTVARLGGDEFAMLLPSTDIEHAKFAARKIQEIIEKPLMLEGHRLYIRGSLGIVVFPEHGDSHGLLMKNADVAMYYAKNTQCGFTVYSPSYDQHSVKNFMLLNDLRTAIESNALELYFQPKISCSNGILNGVECLLRWNHPELGFILPGKFIPIAEHTELIMPLTLWVINAALREMSVWRSKGVDLDFNISVNLSSRNLLDNQFAEEIENLLKIWAIEPHRLEFEITESAVMEDPENALVLLDELSSMGVKLSIDDFGTGYTSIGYLKKLPVNEIKIDKSFVIHMLNDEPNLTIVRSTIDLAHNLGLTVVAEGVESLEALEKLKSLGCDLAQGYYICHPLSSSEISKWFRKKHVFLNK